MIGGSCSKTENGKPGQGKLRLKVYICKDNEPCDLCRTAGCYYKGNLDVILGEDIEDSNDDSYYDIMTVHGYDFHNVGDNDTND